MPPVYHLERNYHPLRSTSSPLSILRHKPSLPHSRPTDAHSRSPLVPFSDLPIMLYFPPTHLYRSNSRPPPLGTTQPSDRLRIKDTPALNCTLAALYAVIGGPEAEIVLGVAVRAFGLMDRDRNLELVVLDRKMARRTTSSSFGVTCRIPWSEIALHSLSP